jgi:hypothetical protein
MPAAVTVTLFEIIARISSRRFLTTGAPKTIGSPFNPFLRYAYEFPTARAV